MTTELAVPSLERYRFSIQEFECMAMRGVIDPDVRLELIDGDIIKMSPIGWRHALCVDKLTALLLLALHTRAHIRIQNPIALSEHDEPQPDAAVLDPAIAQQRRQPLPHEVWLAIEVADSTLARDKQVKLPLYARAGIREVWIVDLDTDTIARYADPFGDTYRAATTYSRNDTIVSATLPELQLQVADILP
jgi:Uma2 family endonuclease